MRGCDDVEKKRGCIEGLVGGSKAVVEKVHGLGCETEGCAGQVSASAGQQEKKEQGSGATGTPTAWRAVRRTARRHARAMERLQVA